MTQPAPIAIEAEVLLCCARLNPTPSQIERIAQLLARDVDWRLLLSLADVHGLSPLLFRHLRVLASSALPKTVYAELWGGQQLLVRRNQSMADSLAKILLAFESRGIPCLPYKGPMLALIAYRDLALREFGDLDLLLRARDIRQAKELLLEMGFEPEYRLTPAAESAMLRSRAHYHLSLLRAQPRLLVELHWKTDSEFAVEPPDDDRWWGALPTSKLGDRSVASFAPADLVLVLCLHGSKHFWASLGWLVDVAELVKQQPGLDWHSITRRAEQLRAARRLALGLVLLRDLLEVPLPEPVQAWLRPHSQAAAVADEIRARVFDLSVPERSAFSRLRLNFRLYESWGQRWRHLVDVVFNPGLAEWSGTALPRPIFFLYLPMRWLRLLRKHAFGAAEGK